MQKSKLRVSIVIPVYNEQGHLEACLEAIARQTVRPYEVIVVDNNSTDSTAKIAASYSFVTLLHESRQGRIFARDKGFNAARGNIIARIDGDSILSENWVEYVKDFYSVEEHHGLAFTGGALFYNVPFQAAVAWLYNLMAFDFNHLLIGHPTLWGSNMAITREQWQAVATRVCRRNGIHEDLDLSIHLHEQNYKIYYDRQFRVGASMRRILTDRQELWSYLQWWPRTLKVHGRGSWLACWLFGSLLIYCLVPFLIVGEKLLHSWGWQPAAETD